MFLLFMPYLIKILQPQSQNRYKGTCERDRIMGLKHTLMQTVKLYIYMNTSES